MFLRNCIGIPPSKVDLTEGKRHLRTMFRQAEIKHRHSIKESNRPLYATTSPNPQEVLLQAEDIAYQKNPDEICDPSQKQY